MIRMMEKYASDLERLVSERTVALEDAQKRADRLLYQVHFRCSYKPGLCVQMLPRSMADSLKAGISVTPQLYASASVLFTDIVSFTVLCGKSTPLQIVSMLNALFSQFDAAVSAHDAYKV
jgi:hypothetical protein